MSKWITENKKPARTRLEKYIIGSIKHIHGNLDHEIKYSYVQGKQAEDLKKAISAEFRKIKRDIKNILWNEGTEDDRLESFLIGALEGGAEDFAKEIKRQFPGIPFIDWVAEDPFDRIQSWMSPEIGNYFYSISADGRNYNDALESDI